MSLRKVRSPEAPKITTLHGCGIGRLDKPSRSGLADNSLLTEKEAEHGPRRRQVANPFPVRVPQCPHGFHERDWSSAWVCDPTQEKACAAGAVLNGEEK